FLLPLAYAVCSPFLFRPSLFSSFFFYCYGVPRDLHSFPTRRSSDLVTFLLTALRCCTAKKLYAALFDVGKLLLDVSVSYLVKGRSEEHTSELQSRFDLVCRLLLEKKNKNRDDR